MTIDLLQSRHKRLFSRRKRHKKIVLYRSYLSTLSDSKCYLTDKIKLGCARRQIEVDLEVYWLGIRYGNYVLAAHARHHFVQHAHQGWPRVSSLVIRRLFRDPRFVLFGELKELAVRAARDHACRERRFPKGIKTMVLSARKVRQRGFQDMLQEELRHSWVVGNRWEHPPPNTWIDHEELYRKELDRVKGCDLKCT